MALADEVILYAMAHGAIDIKGEFLWGSNYTFLVQIEHHDIEFQAVYKPARGERPLWDFPTASLGRREVAAYIVSEALGWRLVPPTVYRKKAPLGAGSLQFFIEHDPEHHYFTFSDDERQQLRPTALFDLLINNADRKGSHILKDPDKHLWLIDHGLCFHVEEKLRTVIWDFVGVPLPPDLCQNLEGFLKKLGGLQDVHSDLARQLLSYISSAELRALIHRAEHLIAEQRFPSPALYHRPYPWPQI
jgi:hypothetical protein